MDSARLDRIQALFHEAADLPPSEHRAFLTAACGDDFALFDEVIALLDEDARASSLLDRDLSHVARQMLGQPPFTPQGFGPYRTRQLLGEGGMGVVYLAEHEDLHHLVAIKILRDAWMSPARRERFASEQRTLAQLVHPSIARLYDADTLADGTPWFAMEYVEGVPLTDYCRRQGSTVDERLRLFRAVCESVLYAHRLAVIHRDLKPSNILVKSDGSVRLLDFGIAKHLDDLDPSLDRTLTGLRLMTPAYAAPEQLRGEPVGIQSDVYSLGVILQELLNGLRSSPDIEVLSLTATHSDVQRRYPSVEALIRDIDHYLKGEPLEARPDTFGYRLGKFLRRNRRAVTATAAAGAVVLTLIIFFTIRLAQARNAAVAEAARTQRIQRFMLNLFEGGDKAAGPAGDLGVTTLIDRGVVEANALEAEPVIQADLYQTLGDIYRKLGKFDRAAPLLQSALDRRKLPSGPGHPDVAGSLVSLALLRVDQAQLPDAERLAREALDIARRAMPPAPASVAKAALALGQVLEARGAYDQAIPVLEESVRLQPSAAAPTPELAASLLELANVHYYAGHYDASDALNQRLLTMHRQLHGGRHPLVAGDLINLGAAQMQRGNYTAAEAFYRQALDITQSFYGQDHHETATVLTGLGRTLVFRERYDEAVALLQQALAIQERVNGPLHPRVASALNELAIVATKRGNLPEAEASLNRVIDIYRTVYGDRHEFIAVAQSNLASAYMAAKQFPRAEQLLREAVARYSQTLAPDHLNVGIGRIKLGRCLLRQQRYREAEEQTLSGYNILVKQASPSVSFLKAARTDLAETYLALNQPEQAARFRTEPAAAGGK